MDDVVTSLTWSRKFKRIGLLGKMGAGKDYIADGGGYTKLGFADPMYLVSRYLFGTSVKSDPGVRSFLQKVGQWGWGKFDEEDPASMDRAAFILAMRGLGHKATEGQGFPFIDWDQFGRTKTFWADILAGRVNGCSKEKLAVVNVRFKHEFEPLIDLGFSFFLVRSSEMTRYNRLNRPFNAELDMNVSEALAEQLEEAMPDNHVIWNDEDQLMPPSRKYLTVRSFLKEANDIN